MPSPKLLIVEDDDSTREFLRELLRFEGIEVVAASNGAEALQRLRTDPPPAVVLLDIVLPDVSSRDVLQAIRGDPAMAAVRVIGMSASRFRPDGLDRFLLKPFELEDLLAELSNLPPSMPPAGGGQGLAGGALPG